jgi:hypothetical protein
MGRKRKERNVSFKIIYQKGGIGRIGKKFNINNTTFGTKDSRKERVMKSYSRLKRNAASPREEKEKFGKREI